MPFYREQKEVSAFEKCCAKAEKGKSVPACARMAAQKGTPFCTRAVGCDAAAAGNALFRKADAFPAAGFPAAQFQTGFRAVFREKQRAASDRYADGLQPETSQPEKHGSLESLPEADSF